MRRWKVGGSSSGLWWNTTTGTCGSVSLFCSFLFLCALFHIICILVFPLGNLIFYSVKWRTLTTRHCQASPRTEWCGVVRLQVQRFSETFDCLFCQDCSLSSLSSAWHLHNYNRYDRPGISLSNMKLFGLAMSTLGISTKDILKYVQTVASMPTTGCRILIGTDIRRYEQDKATGIWSRLSTPLIVVIQPCHWHAIVFDDRIPTTWLVGWFLLQVRTAANINIALASTPLHHLQRTYPLLLMVA